MTGEDQRAHDALAKTATLVQTSRTSPVPPGPGKSSPSPDYDADVATRKALPTLVLLVRHGETPTTGVVLPGRAPGLGLSERGTAQAAAVAERLVGLKVDAVYTSPVERAQLTAAPTASALGLTPTIDDGLAEADTGDWTGLKLADLARKPEWRGLQAAPSTFRFPGGESFTELQARVLAALARIRDLHPGGVAVCFSHADPIKVALAHALGTPLDLHGRIDVGPGSVSAIEFPPAGPPAVRLVNSAHDPLATLRG